MLLRFVPTVFNFKIVRNRKVFLTLSMLLCLTSLGMYMSKGLNYGIDFRGGGMLETRAFNTLNLEDVRQTLSRLKLGDFAIQSFGTNKDYLIKFEYQKGGQAQQDQAIERIKTTLQNVLEVRRVETVGPKLGSELINNGLQAILYGLLAIMVYVWFRFEWQFGLCAVIALVHDAIGVFGLYSVFQHEFNTTAIVAILTTIGYSINDTVVIYDRIRENLKRYKKMPVAELVNLSINETFSRTIMTSGTTLVALLSLYFFGGEVIATYSLPIICGVVIGTYSSIFVAGPLLLNFNLEKIFEEPEEAVIEDASSV